MSARGAPERLVVAEEGGHVEVVGGLELGYLGHRGRSRRHELVVLPVVIVGCCATTVFPSPSKPVAITVTQNCPVRSGSTEAPKMILASAVAASRTIAAASVTSTSPRSSPPAIESTMPLAPRISRPSSGDAIARLAASMPRLAPLAMPTPMSAFPDVCMTVRTSAKSRLIRPGRVIRSQMPWTPCRRTSSATRKASSIEVPRSSTCSRRSLGTTMTVSTSTARRSRPRSATVWRRDPSKPNGIVTIATVSAPSSRASRATTGAAPLPVPPPSPTATKTMSEPRSASRRRSLPASATRLPSS